MRIIIDVPERGSPDTTMIGGPSLRFSKAPLSEENKELSPPVFRLTSTKTVFCNEPDDAANQRSIPVPPRSGQVTYPFGVSRPDPKSNLLLIALACGVVGCGGGADEATDLAAIVESLPRPAPRILLIGLDGADWSVARPLMDEGRLPTLASLVQAGASGELRSIEPMISPALWTSGATGVRPEAHGIRDFVYRERGSYAQPIVNSSVRERLAVWNLLSALGLSVGVVDWYATWPAEKVNGLIVSDRINRGWTRRSRKTSTATASPRTCTASTDRISLRSISRGSMRSATSTGSSSIPTPRSSARSTSAKRPG
jgi:hypothetical protein